MQFFCFNFFGDEHFYLSILVDCIVHRLVYFCSRLACKFSFLRLQERAYAIRKTIKISCMRGSECFTGTGACFYYSEKQLKYRGRAVLDVLRVQERASTIRKTTKKSYARGFGCFTSTWGCFYYSENDLYAMTLCAPPPCVFMNLGYQSTVSILTPNTNSPPQARFFLRFWPL